MLFRSDYIVEETGADLYQIVTDKVYPSVYGDTTNLARTEQRNNEKPSLRDAIASIDAYDIIFVGYPNWWGTLPQAVFTFLESYDFLGKTIIPFTSHEGSGFGSGPRDIASTIPEATLLDGFVTRGSNVMNAESDVVSWLQGLGIAY